MGKMDEQIFVVPADTLPIFTRSLMQDTTTIDHVNQVVQQYGCFKRRGDIEEDEQYKQLIPYIIVRRNNSFFVMQRKSTCGEQRLAGKISLGVGGHIRQSDIEDLSSFSFYTSCWWQREFEEELVYPGNKKNLDITCVGLINDQTTAVGRVHLGVVYVLNTQEDVFVRSEHVCGFFEEYTCLLAHTQTMEEWSRIFLDGFGVLECTHCSGGAACNVGTKQVS